MSNEMPPDGLLSGEQGEPEGNPVGVASPELVEAAQALAQRMQAPVMQGWRPACTFCANGHKLAIGEMTQKLMNKGVSPGSPEFQQAMQAAAQAGMMFAQNPQAPGMNGQHPDMIPPVRPADLIVNGTTLCILCFTPQKQTSLLAAPAGWSPGR